MASSNFAFFRFLLVKNTLIRWPNTVFKCLCLIHHYFKLVIIWRPFFARVKVNHRRVYSRVLVKVCAVAMATGLVKNKA